MCCWSTYLIYFITGLFILHETPLIPSVWISTCVLNDNMTTLLLEMGYSRSGCYLEHNDPNLKSSQYNNGGDMIINNKLSTKVTKHCDCL